MIDSHTDFFLSAWMTIEEACEVCGVRISYKVAWVILV
jgi:hypothetical protein